MYKIAKVAGMILDQQDDPGFVWEEIAEFWPDYMDEPQIGIQMEKNACIAEFEDGSYRYPTNTPENTLASAMYFVKHGVKYMDEPEMITKIAHDIKAYMLIHGVELPAEFSDYARKEEYIPKHNDYFADEDQNLPITTHDQTVASIAMFQKHAHDYSVEDRLNIAEMLKEACEYHEIPQFVKEASLDLSRISDGIHSGIWRRKQAMLEKKRAVDSKEDNEFFDGYLGVMDAILECDDEPIKIASLLEEVDREFGMHEGWGVHFPDPIDTVFMQKNAEYDGVDFSPLSGHLDDYIVSAISEDPYAVIPTLPLPHKQIVDQYMKSIKR
jgi:hypothetical protein